jgi:hypothetical protein
MSFINEWLKGLIQKSSGMVPRNLNPRSWIARQRDIQGGYHQYPYLKANDEGWAGDPNFPPSKTQPGLLDLYPEKMVLKMKAVVANYPQSGTATEFILDRRPVEENGEFPFNLSDENSPAFWKKFWNVWGTVTSSSTRVYQYASNAMGGGAPPYPYEENVAWEVNWKDENVASDGNKWYRFRTDDEFEVVESVKIYNWTRPIAIGSGIESGDYIDKRFRRQNIDETVKDSSQSLTQGKSYRVFSGIITYDSIAYETGRIFVCSQVTSFSGDGTVREVVPVPPRSVNGLPNNEPEGWFDNISDLSGTAMLWMIEAHKSIYGQLKETGWIGPKRITEDPSFLRYGKRATPNPNEIVNNKVSGNGLTTWNPLTEAATIGSTYDVELIANGWDTAHDGNHMFIAYRSPDGFGGYTLWIVEKVGEESGEFTDRVFKLFDINLDYDNAFLAPPINSDASLDGWSDVLLPESGTKINYISEARKFFDGTLKTLWSRPVPYTGQSVFNDVIVSDFGDDFKYDKDGNVTPDLITLTAKLFRGITRLWEQPGITILFDWKKVYDNGQIINISPSSNQADAFHLISSSGSAGQPGYFFADQRIGIRPDAVTGKAVFRCTMTLVMEQGDNIIFTEEFSVLDVTDGIDAKNLSIHADNQLFVYDSSNTTFVPLNIVLRAYQSNIPNPTFYWYKWTGVNWSLITSGIGGYIIVGNTLSIATSVEFEANATAQEIRYAVSTHSNNPDSADYDATFSDYVSIGKISAIGVGAPGEDAMIAILDNESHTVVLDEMSGIPQSGEIGLSGKAITRLQLWDGNIKRIYNSDYTISLTSSSSQVQFATSPMGNDVSIYVSGWSNPGTPIRSAVCTIEIVYGSVVIYKKFSVASTLDAIGAMILDIDSNRGFTFLPSDSSNKILTANFYHSGVGNQPITLVNGVPIKYKWEALFGQATPIISSPNTTQIISYHENNRVIEITPGMVSNQLSLRCYAVIGNDLSTVRSRTISISDIPDGTMQRLYWHGESQPAKPTGAYLSHPVSGDGAWVRTINSSFANSIWASDKPVDAPLSEWSNPYRIKGERGFQGQTGDRIVRIYLDSESHPGQPSPNDVPKAGSVNYPTGWTLTIPAVVNNTLWAAEGRISGETGYVVGTWSPAQRFSGNDGQAGSPGAPGPGYVSIADLGIINLNRRITFNPVNGAEPRTIDIPTGLGLSYRAYFVPSATYEFSPIFVRIGRVVLSLTTSKHLLSGVVSTTFGSNAWFHTLIQGGGLSAYPTLYLTSGQITTFNLRIQQISPLTYDLWFETSNGTNTLYQSYVDILLNRAINGSVFTPYSENDSVTGDSAGKVAFNRYYGNQLV